MNCITSNGGHARVDSHVIYLFFWIVRRPANIIIINSRKMFRDGNRKVNGHTSPQCLSWILEQWNELYRKVCMICGLGKRGEKTLHSILRMQRCNEHNETMTIRCHFDSSRTIWENFFGFLLVGGECRNVGRKFM